MQENMTIKIVLDGDDTKLTIDDANNVSTRLLLNMCVDLLPKLIKKYLGMICKDEVKLKRSMKKAVIKEILSE